MKKVLFFLMAVCAMVAAPMTNAQVTITKLDRVAPTDEMYMDMAVSLAKDSKNGDGAVVILNNAPHATGAATASKSATETALGLVRTKSLKFAKVYVVYEPTSSDINKLAAFKTGEVYFVNSREDAIKAGVHSAEDYDESKIAADLTAPKLNQMDYAPAAALVK